ncbi:50S ribosomal protein L32e [Candidatus Woesearchaeota archaeon]|nr:50S ribosomal protein L32e [Candidatus Woesearchaeota archaeon]
MADKKALLEQRKKTKAKKPSFIYQDAHKKIALPKKWRRPRGLHSKIRLNKRGYRRKIQIGWKSPVLVRGLHPSGYAPVLISNVSDVALLDKNQHGIILSSTLGAKKKAQVIEEAGKKGITILNIKDPKKYLEDQKKKFEDKKGQKKKKAEEKKAKKKKLEEKKKSKEKVKETAPVVAPEYATQEKIKAEKKEKDKILITGQ